MPMLPPRAGGSISKHPESAKEAMHATMQAALAKGIARLASADDSAKLISVIVSVKNLDHQLLFALYMDEKRCARQTVQSTRRQCYRKL